MPFDCVFFFVLFIRLRLNWISNLLSSLTQSYFCFIVCCARVCVHSTPTPLRWRTQLLGTAHVHNALHERPDPERGKLNKMILNCIRSFTLRSCTVAIERDFAKLKQHSRCTALANAGKSQTIFVLLLGAGKKGRQINKTILKWRPTMHYTLFHSPSPSTLSGKRVVCASVSFSRAGSIQWKPFPLKPINISVCHRHCHCEHHPIHDSIDSHLFTSTFVFILTVFACGTGMDGRLMRLRRLQTLLYLLWILCTIL